MRRVGTVGQESVVTSWWNWPFEATSTLSVQGTGFWMNIAGLLLTAAGFVVTFQQLAKTKSAAEAAQSEAKRIEISLKGYDAAQEVSKARYALRTARKHLGNEAWSDGAESYDDVRRSLLALKSGSISLDAETIKTIDKAASYIAKFCERVDRNGMENASIDELAKTKSVMRGHEELIDRIGAKLHKDVF